MTPAPSARPPWAGKPPASALAPSPPVPNQYALISCPFAEVTETGLINYFCRCSLKCASGTTSECVTFFFSFFFSLSLPFSPPSLNFACHGGRPGGSLLMGTGRLPRRPQENRVTAWTMLARAALASEGGKLSRAASARFPWQRHRSMAEVTPLPALIASCSCWETQAWRDCSGRAGTRLAVMVVLPPPFPEVKAITEAIRNSSQNGLRCTAALFWLQTTTKLQVI